MFEDKPFKKKKRKRGELGKMFYKVLFIHLKKVIKMKSRKTLPSYGLESSEKRTLLYMRKESDPRVDMLKKSLSDFPKFLAPKRMIIFYQMG